MISEKRFHFPIQPSTAARVGLVVVAMVASLAAGTTGLVVSSPFAPLLVGGAVAATAIGMAWLRKPVWALYAAIFVALLPEGLIPVHINDVLNRSTLLIALGVWLFDAMARRRQIVWTSTALLMLGFLIWGAVTLAWAPNLDLGIESVVQYAVRMVLFLLLVVNEINTKETLDGLMRTLALIGWLWVLAGAGTVLFQGYEPETRLLILGANVHDLGILTMAAVPGVLWQVMQASERQKALRMSLSVVFILLALTLVALSGSRGGALSWLVILLAFWFWKPTRPWGKLGLLILAVAAVSAPFIFTITLDRFGPDLLGEADGVLGGRLPIWQAAWQLILDHPWDGVGIGNASYEVMPYYRMLTSWGRERRAIHNPVLAIWAETGIPGLLLYLGVLGSAVWSFVRHYLHVRETRARSIVPYFALISSVFAGFMLSWIKGGGIESSRTFFLLLALLLIPSRLNLDGVDGNTESNVQGAERRKL